MRINYDGLVLALASCEDDDQFFQLLGVGILEQSGFLDGPDPPKLQKENNHGQDHHRRRVSRALRQ